VAWADAAREASRLGAGQRTAETLATGAGNALAGSARVVVAAHGEVLLARWLPPGSATASVRVGPLPHLHEVAAATARRPAYVVLLAERDGTAIVVHPAGDQHILEAVSDHLPGSLGPVITIASGPVSGSGDDQLGPEIAAALDEITAEATAAVGDLVASSAAGPEPAAVRGIESVAQQLAEQQVAVLLVAADIAGDTTGSSYWNGSRPTELLVDDSSIGTQVPLEDGLVWAALHQDAVVLQLPDRTGPLGGQPAAALLRRGAGS